MSYYISLAYFVHYCITHEIAPFETKHCEPVTVTVKQWVLNIHNAYILACILFRYAFLSTRKIIQYVCVDKCKYGQKSKHFQTLFMQGRLDQNIIYFIPQILPQDAEYVIIYHHTSFKYKHKYAINFSSVSEQIYIYIYTTIHTHIKEASTFLLIFQQQNLILRHVSIQSKSEIMDNVLTPPYIL